MKPTARDTWGWFFSLMLSVCCRTFWHRTCRTPFLPCVGQVGLCRMAFWWGGGVWCSGPVSDHHLLERWCWSAFWALDRPVSLSLSWLHALPTYAVLVSGAWHVGVLGYSCVIMVCVPLHACTLCWPLSAVASMCWHIQVVLGVVLADWVWGVALHWRCCPGCTTRRTHTSQGSPQAHVLLCWSHQAKSTWCIPSHPVPGMWLILALYCTMFVRWLGLGACITAEHQPALLASQGGADPAAPHTAGSAVGSYEDVRPWAARSQQHSV